MANPNPRYHLGTREQLRNLCAREGHCRLLRVRVRVRVRARVRIRPRVRIRVGVGAKVRV